DRARTFAYRYRTRSAIRFGRRKIPGEMAMAPATNTDRQCRRAPRTGREWWLVRRAHNRWSRVVREGLPPSRWLRAGTRQPKIQACRAVVQLDRDLRVWPQ